MIDFEDGGDWARNVGRRLKLSGLAIGGHDQKMFDEEAGLEQSLYNRFESGVRLLTLQSAMQICQRYNLTLDWLYRGDLSDLPHRLVQQIETLRR